MGVSSGDRQSLEIPRVAFEALKGLLRAPSDELVSATDEAIAKLGAGLSLSRVFVQLWKNATQVAASHHWTPSGPGSWGQALTGLGVDEIPFWQQRLRADKPLLIHDVGELSDEISVHGFLEADGVATLLVFPIHHQNALVGILGLATDSPRQFSPDEIESLETIADAISSLAHRAGQPEGLERVNACLRATLDAIPDLVLELGPDGRFLKYQLGRSMTHLPLLEQVNGHLPEEVLPPEGVKIVRDVIADVDSTGSSEGRIFYYDLPSERRWYQISAAAHDEGGYVLVVQDITSQRAHLRELEWLGDVARRTSNLVVVSDVEGRIEWVNPAFEAISGWTLDEVRGRAPGDFLYCDRTDPDTVARIDDAIKSREAIDIEILNRSRSGTDFWLKIQIAPRFDGKGRHLGFIAVETDVTDLIDARSAASAAEQRATASREQLVSAVEALNDGFILFDAEDRLVLTNTRYKAIYSRTAPVMIEGTTFQDILKHGISCGDFRLSPGEEKRLIALRREGKFVGSQVRRFEDGRVLRIHDNPTVDGGRVALCSDITDLTLAQKRLRAIVEGASVGTWEWSIPTGHNDINSRWAEIIGYRLDELSMEIGQFRALCHDDDLRMMDAELQDVLSGERTQFDLRLRMRHKEGRWIWVLCRGQVLQRDPDGKPVLLSGIHMDITELVEARERAETASAAKSAFLAAMSHEIRTPLNGVLGMADLLARSSLHEDQRHMLDIIRESGWSLLAVLDDILDLSRLEAGKLELETRPFNLPLLLGRLESLHSAAAHSKGLAFEVVLRGDGRERVGDPMRITQILQNLIGNAIKFTASGQVRVEIEAGSHDHVGFRVTDTGIGMTEDAVSRVFEVFQQADSGIARRYGGSGLGLAIVQRLVEQMLGTVSVSSTPGQGTSITLRLPLASTTAAVVPGAGADGPEAKSAVPTRDLVGLRVLVAEDNATNRKILQIMLGKLGVNACFAEDGAQALTLWRKQPFDLVILDISMPVIDGIEALQTMQREARAAGMPQPRVIAATANVMKEQVEGYRQAGFIETIPKPIRFEKLADVLARASEIPVETATSVPDNAM